jgi:hypothetical protein
MENPNNEKQYRVIITECGLPTSCHFVGTMEDCEIMAQAWCITHRNHPCRRYLDVVIDEVRYDEYGDVISFAELRDEYDHCYEMGDFDY